MVGFHNGPAASRTREPVAEVTASSEWGEPSRQFSKVTRLRGSGLHAT